MEEKTATIDNAAKDLRGALDEAVAQPAVIKRYCVQLPKEIPKPTNEEFPHPANVEIVWSHGKETQPEHRPERKVLVCTCL